MRARRSPTLDLLVVQDIFPTETAWLADVILPASAFPEKTGTFTNTDRMVQLARQALEPPGQARQDLWIINQMARRLGLDWHYEHPREVFEEMRGSMDSIAGISWERMLAAGQRHLPLQGRRRSRPAGGVHRPLSHGDRQGDGWCRRARAFADERPDAQYPYVLVTGRQLEHWHTGAMTRRSYVLDATEPEATAAMHGSELVRLGLQPGELGRGRFAARRHPAEGARGRRHRARQRLHPLRLCGSSRQPAHQPGARSRTARFPSSSTAR